MPGGFISNRDESQTNRSARAVSNASAPTSVRPQLDQSQGHSISIRRVPNKGTSATRAVAWGSDGRLIDPQKSNSTGRDWRLLLITAPRSSVCFWASSNFSCVKCLVSIKEPTVGKGRIQKLLPRWHGQGLSYTAACTDQRKNSLLHSTP